MNRFKKWRLRRAYRLVLKDLSKVGLFRGVYDAKHGSDSFMYGVQSVMETIALEAGKLEFEDLFVDNLVQSQLNSGVSNGEVK